jgi:hypothetical protein
MGFDACAVRRIMHALLLIGAGMRELGADEQEGSIEAQLRADIRAACTRYISRAFGVEGATLDMLVDTLDERTQELPHVRHKRRYRTTTAH